MYFFRKALNSDALKTLPAGIAKTPDPSFFVRANTLAPGTSKLESNPLGGNRVYRTHGLHLGRPDHLLVTSQSIRYRTHYVKEDYNDLAWPQAGKLAVFRPPETGRIGFASRNQCTVCPVFFIYLEVSTGASAKETHEHEYFSD
jgi:hypothetical protein